MMNSMFWQIMGHEGEDLPPKGKLLGIIFEGRTEACVTVGSNVSVYISVYVWFHSSAVVVGTCFGIRKQSPFPGMLRQTVTGPAL